MSTEEGRRKILVRASIAFLAAGAMLGGSYALVGSGDNAAVGQGLAKGNADRVKVNGRVVAEVKNSAELDEGVTVITVPLGVNFEVPGSLYGTKAKKPLSLGPAGVKGMTQDGFGTQVGMLLPDGERVVYHFWQQLTRFPSYAPGSPEVADGTPMSRPTIRLLDLSTGEDRELASGARSFAWRADGLFAYARGVETDYRLNVPYDQHVVVQEGLEGKPEVWTTEPGNYTVVQWAGESLLVWRQFEGETRELLALQGPGESRQVLSEQDLFLCASPDGTRILTSSGGTDPDTDPFVIHEVEMQSGTELARLPLEGVTDPATGEAVTGVPVAAWEGDKVVVALHPAHVAVIRAEGEGLELQDVLTFQYANVRKGGVDELMFTAGGSKLHAVISEETGSGDLERTAVVTYDFADGSCRRWIVPGTASATGLVRNQSRPR